VILALLETPRFKTPSFSDTSYIHRGRSNEDRILEMSHANAIDAFIQTESKQLHVDSLEDVATLLEMRENQHILLHEPIVAKAKSLLKHSCVYLSTVGTDDATNETMGTLCCSVVYGRELSGGAVAPMTEYGLNVGVKLPHNGDRGIKNPLYSPTVAAYLRDTWMQKISLWSRGVVDLVESALDMEIEGKISQESLEGIKHGSDVDEHFSDPSEYVLHGKSGETLIKSMADAETAIGENEACRDVDVLTLETNLLAVSLASPVGLNGSQSHQRGAYRHRRHCSDELPHLQQLYEPKNTNSQWPQTTIQEMPSGICVEARSSSSGSIGNCCSPRP
jgi:hypothetical protein